MNNWVKAVLVIVVLIMWNRAEEKDLFGTMKWSVIAIMLTIAIASKMI